MLGAYSSKLDMSSKEFENIFKDYVNKNPEWWNNFNFDDLFNIAQVSKKWWEFIFKNYQYFLPKNKIQVMTKSIYAQMDETEKAMNNLFEQPTHIQEDIVKQWDKSPYQPVTIPQQDISKYKLLNQLFFVAHKPKDAKSRIVQDVKGICILLVSCYLLMGGKIEALFESIDLLMGAKNNSHVAKYVLYSILGITILASCISMYHTIMGQGQHSQKSFLASNRNKFLNAGDSSNIYQRFLIEEQINEQANPNSGSFIKKTQ